MKKRNVFRLFSLFVMLFSIGWSIFFINLFYEYHFTSILFFVMLSNWLVILNLLIGLAGSIIGFMGLVSKIKSYIPYVLLIFIYIIFGFLTFIYV